MSAVLRSPREIAVPSCVAEVASKHAAALGQVFTPPALVDFIFDQAGYTASAGIIDRPLLE